MQNNPNGICGGVILFYSKKRFDSLKALILLLAWYQI